jgi:hypothetical protein
MNTQPLTYFEKDEKYELVYEDGRPSYYRERSIFLKWDANVSFQPLYPCGIMIQPSKGANSLSVSDIDAQKVRALAEINSPVLLRGFLGTTNRDLFFNKASELGTPQSWKFGYTLEVKEQSIDILGFNNTLSAEQMPFHYDGIFKLDKKVEADGTELHTSNPPK